MAEDPSSRGTGPQTGCLVLFGLAFALGGVALAFYTWRLAGGPLDSGEITFRAVMCAVITGAGIALMLFGSAAGRTARVTATLAGRSPDKPWLWREDWAQGYASPESESQKKTMALVGFLCLLVSAPIVLVLPRELLDRRNYPALAGFAFPLAGLFLVGQSLVSHFRERRFRNVRLTFSGVPAVIGGDLKGRIEGEFLLPQEAQVDLTLSCVRSYRSAPDSRRTQWQKVLWQDTKSARAYTGGRDTHIPVEFTIPYDLSPTDGRNPDDEIFWRIGAGADLPGLDLRFTFRAPVFRTDASDPELTVAALEAREAGREVAKPADTKVVAGPSGSGGVQFYLPPARSKGAAAATSVFAILCLGPALFFGWALAQSWWWILGLIPLLIFGLIGVLLGSIAVWLWFGSTRIEVAGRALHVRTWCLGFSRLRIVRAGEIDKLELHAGMQRGDQVWYDVRIRLASGRRMTAGTGLEKDEAEWLLAAIRKDLAI